MELDGVVFHEHFEFLAYSGSYLRLASSKNQKLEFEEVVDHSRMNPMVVASSSDVGLDPSLWECSLLISH